MPGRALHGLYWPWAICGPCSTVKPPKPVALASALTAEGLCQIFWPLYCSKFSNQKCNSDSASAETGITLHYDFLLLRDEYKLWVMKRAIGPKAMVMEIILPVTLAKIYAVMVLHPITWPSCCLRACNLVSGTWICPWARLIFNPSHVRLLTGSSWDFPVLMTNPALAKSACTLLLAAKAFYSHNTIIEVDYCPKAPAPPKLNQWTH